MAIICDNQPFYKNSFGNLTYNSDSPKITNDTLFDLASLTKVICTTSCIMKLIELGLINLDDKTAKYLDELRNTDKQDITIEQLLNHSSGLAADLASDQQEVFKKWDAQYLWQTILQKPLEYTPGTKSNYSDFDFIILGKIVERISGISLDNFFEKYFTKKMNLKNLVFNPLENGFLLSGIAPTEFDNKYRKRLIHGFVHDEKAAILNGVAGHAGLFGSINDVTEFMKMILNKSQEATPDKILAAEILQKFLNYKDKYNNFKLGWKYGIHRIKPKYEHLVSDSAFSHLGFTGCSIWVDPEKGMCLICLTNRVYPTRDNQQQMLKFRGKITKIFVNLN